MASNPASKLTFQPEGAVLKSLQDNLEPNLELNCKTINLKEHNYNFLFFQHQLFYSSLPCLLCDNLC